MVEISRAHGILPVWIFMPTLENPVEDEEIANLARLAQEAGFVVLNMADAYENQDPEFSRGCLLGQAPECQRTPADCRGPIPALWKRQR